MLIQEDTIEETQGRTVNESVGYLSLWGTSIKKDQELDPCQDLMWYDEECYDLSGWHAQTNFNQFDDGDICTVLVKTKGGTCKSFCNTQGRECYYAQDNLGNGCVLNDDHDRQTTDENGCL